jgi:hypothetical protein
MAVLSHQRLPCWLVGTQVYGGMRELIFQVEEPYVRGFDGICAQINREFGGTELAPYDGWTFFNEKIAPDEDARCHISNRDLLEALKRHGADVSKPHVLDHTFVGAAPGLAQVKQALVAAGFQERGSSASHVTLSASAALDQDAIDALTARLRGVAKHYGARYDGWGAAFDRR